MLGLANPDLSSPALLAFLLWMTLTPSFFELLAPALRLSPSLVLLIPHSLIAFPVSLPSSSVPLSISAISHAPPFVLNFGSIADV